MGRRRQGREAARHSSCSTLNRYSVIPIHELLSRIRWDPEFGAADFEIGYYDRVANQIMRVPFSRILPGTQNHFQCQLINEEGVTVSVPLHRIRAVYRDGVLIWSRRHLQPDSEASGGA